MCGKKETMKKLRRLLEVRRVPAVRTTQFMQGRTTRWGVAWSFAKEAGGTGATPLQPATRPAAAAAAAAAPAAATAAAAAAASAPVLAPAMSAAPVKACWKMTFEMQIGRSSGRGPTEVDPGRFRTPRRVIQRISNPRCMVQTASFDVASDVWQAMDGGVGRAAARGGGGGVRVRAGRQGGAVQVDPIKPKLKALEITM
jgi:hypothetical protein